MYDHCCNEKSCKLDKLNNPNYLDYSFNYSSKSPDYQRSPKCESCKECYQDDYSMIDQDNVDDCLFKNLKYDHYYDPNYNHQPSKPFKNECSKKKKKSSSKENAKKMKDYKEFKDFKDKSIALPAPLPPPNDKQLDLPSCYTCEKSKFQTIQTYESVKYILMTIILVSIIDGLFTLNYQKLLIQHLQIILLKHKNPVMFSCCDNKLFLFNDDKLRIATGLLYLINVSIQFIGFVGISNDSLILTCSYSIYSIICFIFTIGTYLNYRRLFISLCINCLLAILSIIFSVMIKIIKPIKKKRNMFVI